MGESTSDLHGSVVEATSAPAADPPSSARDLGRVLLCAALVAASVQSVASALVLVPFIPVLVALRLLQAGRHFEFLVAVTGVSALAAVAVRIEASSFAIGAGIGTILVTAWLGVLHARAAAPDPEMPGSSPEPRLETGFNLALGAWILAVALVAVIALPAIDLGRIERDAVDAAYSTYDEACDNGVLAKQVEFCDNMFEQRDRLRDIVRSNETTVFAAVLAMLALAGAWTAHLTLTWRGRHRGLLVRGRCRVRAFETHWAAAYVASGGLVLALAGRGIAGDAGSWMLGIGAFAIVLGGALIVAHGLGMLFELLHRRKSPRWYRGLLVFVALVAPPFAIAGLAILGMLDIALGMRNRTGTTGDPRARPPRR